ncbi:hypothetical protein MHTCC0001_23660 [Flavobacteriaceae bacterium MHTCC 0001]
MKKILLVLSIALTVFNCSSSDEDNSGGAISDQILTGTVEGRAFTFKGGKAFITTNFEDEEAISLNLTNVEVGCETFVGDYDLSISAIVPNQVGMHQDINIVTHQDGESPFNHLGQVLEITAISNTEVSGKMRLNFPSNDDFFKESIFEGTFTLTICE